MDKTKEQKIGYGVTIAAVLVGLSPSIFPMTASIILGFRVLFVALLLAMIVIFADAWGYRRSGVVFGVAIFLFGLTILFRDVRLRSPFVSTAVTDERDIPPESIKTFVDELLISSDPAAQFHLACKTEDACAIAQKYLSRLTLAGWTVTKVDSRVERYGLYLLTPSDSDHPAQAADLARAYENASGAPIPWYNDPTLQAHEFALVVGPLKPGSFGTIALWLPIVGVALLIMGAIAIRRRSPRSKMATVGLTLRNSWLDSYAPGLGFPRKFNVVFSNDTAVEVNLGEAIWITDRIGPQSSKPPTIIYQTKDPSDPTRRKWHQPSESRSKVISPGQWVKVWIGLDSSLPDDELKKQVGDQRLGVLEVPVKVSGIDIKLRTALYFVPPSFSSAA